MSIIAAAYTKPVFFIATDTLTSRYDSDGKTPFPGTICNFSTKITYYPHLKCCIVTLGSSQLSFDHDEFVLMNYFEDLEDLYKKTAGKFCDSVKPEKYLRGDNLIGCIMIFGYNETAEEMQGYKVTVNHDKAHKAEQMDLLVEEGVIPTFMAPRITTEEETEIWKRCEEEEGGADITKVLVEITKKMHEKSLSPDTYQYVVGGEINLTVIGVVNGQFICNNAIVHRFHDYEDNKKRIKHFNDFATTIHEHDRAAKAVADLQTH